MDKFVFSHDMTMFNTGATTKLAITTTIVDHAIYKFIAIVWRKFHSTPLMTYLAAFPVTHGVVMT